MWKISVWTGLEAFLQLRQRNAHFPFQQRATWLRTRLVRKGTSQPIIKETAAATVARVDYNIIKWTLTGNLVCLGLNHRGVSRTQGSRSNLHQLRRPSGSRRVPAAGQVPAGEMERKVWLPESLTSVTSLWTTASLTHVRIETNRWVIYGGSLTSFTYNQHVLEHTSRTSSFPLRVHVVIITFLRVFHSWPFVHSTRQICES